MFSDCQRPWRRSRWVGRSQACDHITVQILSYAKQNHMKRFNRSVLMAIKSWQEWNQRHFRRGRRGRNKLPAKPKKGLAILEPNSKSNCSHVWKITSFRTLLAFDLPLLFLYMDCILFENCRFSGSQIPYFFEISSNRVIVLGFLVNCHNSGVCLQVCAQFLKGKQAYRNTQDQRNQVNKTIFLG